MDNVVICKKDYDRIKSLKYKDLYTSMQDISDEQRKEIILFHLPSNMEQYIKVLVREIEHVVANDLSSYLHTYVPSTNVKYLAMAEINNGSQNNFDGEVNEN